MRRLVPVLFCVVACGGKNNAKEDAPAVPADEAIDAPSPPPVLPPCANPVNGTTISVRRIGPTTPPLLTVASPLLVTSPPGDARLFVVARVGEIQIIENETLRAQSFIDLSAGNGGPVLAGGEQGLLGLAFHPLYHINRQFFVYYTKRQSPTDNAHPFRDVVARCQTMASDPNQADPASCVEILAIPDFASNHNGGMIEFGLDGKLYIGTGDGGSANDPDGNGQTLTNGAPVLRSIALLGKLLRIDVDLKEGGKEYGIPADNPFPGSGAPEVFALGLRNPWRWSFDRLTGDIWIGDVGQDTYEELDVVKAADISGTNFGWSMWESGPATVPNACFKPPCVENGIHFPQDIRDQANDGWLSIIGGQVYRGTCYPDIAGTYFYTDHTAGGLVSATLNVDGTINKTDLNGAFPNGVTSIHAAATGELYMTTIGGQILHIEAGP